MRRISVALLLVGVVAAAAGCSKSVVQTMVHPTPSVLSRGAETGSSFVVLTWTKSPDADFASYEVHELPDTNAVPSSKTRLQIIADRNTTSYRIDGLQPLSTHIYRIRTYLKGGQSVDGLPIVVTTQSGDCAPPDSIHAYNPNDFTRNTAVAKWSPDCASNFVSYSVYLSQTQGFTPSGDNLRAVVQYCTDTSYVLADLAPVTTYYYRVVVSNLCGLTAVSNEANFTTRDATDTIPPETPQLYPFDRSDVTGTSIRVRWYPAPDTDWDSYQVFISTQDGFGPGPTNQVYSTHVLTDTSLVITQLKSGEPLRPATSYFVLVLDMDHSGNVCHIPANTGVVTSPPLDPQYRFGGFGRIPGSFDNQRGATVDPQGRLYVADTGNNRIQVFAAPLAVNPDTTFLYQIPNAGDDTFTLSTPSALALDDSGNVYICDQGRQRVVRTSPSGQFQFAFGGPGTAQDKFQSITGIAVDGSHNLWVVDQGTNRVVKFTATGQFLGAFTSAFSGSLSQPTGVAYDPTSRKILVVDTGNQRVVHYTTSGGTSNLGEGTQGDLGVFGVAGSDSGVFNQPTELAVDVDGTVYVVDTGNQRIQVYVGGALSPQGIFQSTISPTEFEDYTFNMVRLNRPRGVAAIPGRMVVMDSGASRCVVAAVTLNAFQGPHGRGGAHPLAQRSGLRPRLRR